MQQNLRKYVAVLVSYHLCTSTQLDILMYHSMQFTKIQNSVLLTHQRPLCNLNFPQKYVVRMLKMLLKILILNILCPNLYLPPPP